MTSRFDGVLISPFSELLASPRGLSDHRGGPHWPDFEQQTTARHCRGGTPVDAEPHEPLPQPGTVDERVAWGGPIVHHFGHQIADFSMRLLPTVTRHPPMPIAFSSDPRMQITSVDEVPVFVKSVWKWFGIPLERVRLITEPTVVRELLVEPQAEQLDGPGPSAEHLALLDELMKQRMGAVEPVEAVYVSRAGQRARFAGEAYLEQALTAAGVTVVRPETLPLDQQLRMYASAKRLIFAEGSALHATQLLGRRLGEVSVLVRRKGRIIAQASIQPRARSLAYLEVSAGVVNGFPPLGPPPTPSPAIMQRKALVSGISVLDPERLVEGLASVVPDFRSRFSTAAFQRARDNDIMGWLSTELNPRWAAVPERVLNTLRDAGVAHLVPDAERLLGQLYPAWTLTAVFELTGAVRELIRETRTARETQARLVELLTTSPAIEPGPVRDKAGAAS